MSRFHLIASSGCVAMLLNMFCLKGVCQAGSPDSSFNGNGQLVDQSHTGIIFASVAYPDGGLLVAGYQYNVAGSDIAVKKYKKEGIIDSSFATNGVVNIDLGAEEEARFLIWQPDGKLLVAGVARHVSSRD